MTLITILSGAVAAEAVILAGLFTLVVRLNGRVNKAPATSTGAVQQMAALVHEAEALSATLAEQLEEQARMQEELLAEQTRLRAELSAVRAGAARPAAAEGEQPAPAVRKRASKAAAATVTIDEPAPTRARARKSAAPAEANDLAADIAAARKRGMDPLGIAIQRGLGKQAAPLA